MLQRIGELVGQLGDVVVRHRRELLAHDLLRRLDRGAVRRRRGVGHFADAQHVTCEACQAMACKARGAASTILPMRSAIGKAGGGRRGGKARIGVEARIDVNLEDPGLALGIDAEVDPGIAGEIEQVPAGLGAARPAWPQAWARAAPARSGAACRYRPRCRASIWRRSRRCAGRPQCQALEQDLGDRQDARAAALPSSRARLNSRPSI